jgi:hypothetical protein
MIRIRLDKHDYALAEREAKALGISLVELLRRALPHSLPARGAARWMRYIRTAEAIRIPG